jgi:hypothetical protein
MMPLFRLMIAAWVGSLASSFNRMLLLRRPTCPRVGTTLTRRPLGVPSFELKRRGPLRPRLCWPRRPAGRAFQRRTDRR